MVVGGATAVGVIFPLEGMLIAAYAVGASEGYI